MQINRLFEIVYILLEKKKISARELSEHFEVSQRTIYRDIDTLCEAGIPIYANRGKGGGISLLENFILNKSVLTKQEQNDILSALQGLHAAGYENNASTLNKLSTLFQSEKPEWIEVDFSYWNSNEEDRQKFTKLKEAILSRKIIHFTYYNSYGQESERTVEPMKLIFRGQAWYLSGYCRSKLENRYFKISRMDLLSVSSETFAPHPQHMVAEGTESEKAPTTEEDRSRPYEAEAVDISLKVDSELAYRVFDEFPRSAITKQLDGSYLVQAKMQPNGWLYGYLLSYEDHLEVLSPPDIREALISKIKNLHKAYRI